MSQKGYEKWKAYEIIWLDACSSIGWHEPGGELTLLEVRSVGLLVDQTRNHITLAASVGTNTMWGDLISIPTSCVKKKRRLR